MPNKATCGAVLPPRSRVQRNKRLEGHCGAETPEACLGNFETSRLGLSSKQSIACPLVANMAYVHQVEPTKSGPLSHHFYYVSQKIYTPFTQSAHRLRPDRTALATATVFRRRFFRAGMNCSGMGSLPVLLNQSASMTLFPARHPPTLPKMIPSSSTHRLARRSPPDRESIKYTSPCQLRLFHPQGGRQPQKRH